jgi:uncharacterized protein
MEPIMGDVLIGTCTESPTGELLRALGEFNRGDWFECHETLEELWAGAGGEMRDFYQGVLQIAVALHHWNNRNFKGAILLLESGTGYLRGVRPVCQRIDVESLRDSADHLRETLLSLGPDRMNELDAASIPRMHLVSLQNQ